MQESQGRVGLVCHVAELQTQEWDTLSFIPIPLTKVPQLPFPCSPGAASGARKSVGIPLHAHVSHHLPLQGSPCLYLGSRVARTENQGESEQMWSKGSKEAVTLPESVLSSEEGVERVKVCLGI